MKIITLWQPWATLMMLELKKNETRGYNTRHRGPVGIHAAANEPAWVRRTVAEEPVFQRVFTQHDLSLSTLPRGAILGAVTIERTIRTEDWLLQNGTDRSDERWFGDYGVNRWAWITANPVRFAKPIPAKGKQGFWLYDLSGYDEEPGTQLHLFR